MIWLIQKSLFDERDSYNDFIKAVEESGKEVKYIDYAFWDKSIDIKLEGISPWEIVPFGTKPLAYYGMEAGWMVYWNPKFKYSDLLQLGEDFINYDMMVAPLDSLQVPDRGKYFVKENAGFNLVKGGVISCYVWEDVKRGYKVASRPPGATYDWHPINGATEFIACPPKKIINEWRVWVIGDRVVTSSQYVKNGELDYINSDDDAHINKFAQSIVKRLEIGMVNYVLDIFETAEGLKVGEINCLHCSGWYAINAGKVIEALVKYAN